MDDKVFYKKFSLGQSFGTGVGDHERSLPCLENIGNCLSLYGEDDAECVPGI